MNIKKIAFTTAATGIMFSSFAGAALAAQPTGAGLNVPDSAQCGSGASSGAFNFQNSVYGEGDTGLNGNSSGFGQAGGSGGGQTGLNNSAVCGNR